VRVGGLCRAIGGGAELPHPFVVRTTATFFGQGSLRRLAPEPKPGLEIASDGGAWASSAGRTPLAGFPGAGKLPGPCWRPAGGPAGCCGTDAGGAPAWARMSSRSAARDAVGGVQLIADYITVMAIGAVLKGRPFCCASMNLDSAIG
jgi:hypothetical protein